MPIPSTGDIQFAPAGAAKFSVDSITDPGGAPAEVIDVDQGFTVSGTVWLPNWLNGKGHVTVYADELGGPIDQRIGNVDFDIVADPNEPNPKPYPWHIDFPGNVLPDPQPDFSQLYRLAAVFTYGEQTTDIAGFVEMGTFLVN